MSDCDYLVSRANSLSGHIGSAHQDLEALKREVGVFWAMNILHARRCKCLLATRDVFHDLRGSMCSTCSDFIGKDKVTVKQHSNRSHPASNVEGHRLQSFEVNISAKWFSPDTDVDEIREANSDLDKEKSIRLENRIL